MTRAQLEAKAYPNFTLVKVEDTDNVREGDYVEWAEGAWTSVDKGSPLIGFPPGTRGIKNYVRLVKYLPPWQRK